MYRFREQKMQVLLVHPGGPFFRNKDQGAWSVPKGEFGEGESPKEAAIREFCEELGVMLSSGDLKELSPIKQKGGKTVLAWTVEGDFDVDQFKTNAFDLEWPPRSGTIRQFPEIDRAGWFDMDQAKLKINEAQAGFLKELEAATTIRPLSP